MAICYDFESLSLILDGGFDVAKFFVDGFCFCWLPDSKWVRRIKQRFSGRLWIYGGLLPWWWIGETEREHKNINIDYE